MSHKVRLARTGTLYWLGDYFWVHVSINSWKHRLWMGIGIREERETNKTKIERLVKLKRKKVAGTETNKRKSQKGFNVAENIWLKFMRLMLRGKHFPFLHIPKLGKMFFFNTISERMYWVRGKKPTLEMSFGLLSKCDNVKWLKLSWHFYFQRGRDARKLVVVVASPNICHKHNILKGKKYFNVFISKKRFSLRQLHFLFLGFLPYKFGGSAAAAGSCNPNES